MVQYKYEAVDKRGQVVEGTIMAESSEKAAVKIKEELGLVPVDIGQLKSRSTKKSLFRGSKTNFLLNFTQQLGNLLNAGIQVDDALDILIKLTSKEHYKEIIKKIRNDIQGGSDLSYALSKHSIFDDTYINMVRAGESGGVLGLCVERLADYIEEDREFKNSIQSALIYPVIVLLMGLLAVGVLFFFVVPRFVKLFGDLGQGLPLPTKILLGISTFLTNYWLFIVIGIPILIIIYVSYSLTDEGQYQLDVIKNRIPYFGQVRIKLAVSRFCRILGTMLQSGVPLLKGLEIAKSTINNQVYVEIIEDLYEAVRKGGTISGYLNGEPRFPELAVFLIGVGERTGQLEEMLLQAADNFAKDVRRSLDKFLTIFEPIVIFVLGLFVLFVVLSILLPIFSLQQLPF